MKSKTKSATALTRYLGDIRDYPRLDRETEIELARAAQDGRPGAFERIIESNLRFVVKIAHEYTHLGLPVEDLINEGNLGLMEAVQRFDPDRGVRLISWAIWWIRRSMRQALSTQIHAVRLPGSQVKKVREVRETTETLTKELGRAPRQDEVAERLTFDPAKLRPIHSHGVVMMSLDNPITEDDPHPAGADLVDENQTSPDDAVIQRETVSHVRQACETLSDHERAVIRGRFGLDDGDPMTLGAIGDQIGRSRERVRQIERSAIEHVRRRFKTETRAPFRIPEHLAAEVKAAS
jgi:RNA polymerase primary sigma factor